jgi:hypothetical protein
MDNYYGVVSEDGLLHQMELFLGLLLVPEILEMKPESWLRRYTEESRRKQ